VPKDKSKKTSLERTADWIADSAAMFQSISIGGVELNALMLCSPIDRLFLILALSTHTNPDTQSITSIFSLMRRDDEFTGKLVVSVKDINEAVDVVGDDHCINAFSIDVWNHTWHIAHDLRYNNGLMAENIIMPTELHPLSVYTSTLVCSRLIEQMLICSGDIMKVAHHVGRLPYLDMR
jgi:hypothetical protein